MENPVINEHLDRLSELPQSLIHHILSFLPMRDVVSTTLLSRHWNNLWTTVPCLNFSGDVSEENGVERLRNFVNQTLTLWNGDKILKFKVTIDKIFDFSLTSDIDLWVGFAVEKKVEELHIGLQYGNNMLYWEFDQVMSSKKNIYWAPQCLNSCSSMRKLSLLGCNLQINGSPLWNQLKSLMIDGFYLSESLINGIMLGSPQLEVFDLQLMESFENLNIQSTSLKRLEIMKYSFLEIDPTLRTMLKICCPNLEELTLSKLMYSKCLFVDVSSLTDVTLNFTGQHINNGVVLDELLGETMRQIFSTIQHVEKLALSYWCAQVLGASPKKYFLTPLPNVKFWRLAGWKIEFGDLIYVLGLFPNIEILKIANLTLRKPSDSNYIEFETNLSKSFLQQLKTVKITSLSSDFSIFRLIEFLLKHATRLENLVFRLKGFKPNRRTRFQISDKLRRMPRSSPTAKVILKIN